VVRPGGEVLLAEPESDLLVGGLNRVGAVDDVSADINGEVSSDGTWLGVIGSGGAEHLSAGGDDIVAFPNHCDDGAGGGVGNEASEEALGGEISVVLLEHLFAGGGQFHTNKLESLSLESANDLTNEASLDAIGLDHNESSLSSCLNHLLFVCLLIKY